MTALSAYRDGARRVASSPALLLATLAVLVAAALPLGVVLRAMVADHLGESATATAVADGLEWDWWQEFLAQSSGVGVTFTPRILGGAAVVSNVSDLVDNEPLAPVVAGVVSVWLVLWSFLAGGIIDRFARNRPTAATGFFAAAGRSFARVLRLGLIALLGYWFLFDVVHEWLFEDLLGWVTRDLAVERTAFMARVALYVLFVALLCAVNLVVDYARIRLVVEDRHSALGALVSGVRFVGRHRRDTAVLYLLNAAGFAVLAALYVSLAPGVGRGAQGAWTALLVGQVYLLGRMWVKLQFYASQTAFFQSRLAHASYMAAPRLTFTSPAEEAIRGGSDPA